jgi:hypothetical protein
MTQFRTLRALCIMMARYDICTREIAEIWVLSETVRGDMCGFSVVL